MGWSFRSGRRFDGVEGADQVLDGDALIVNQNAAVTSYGSDKRSRPPVLVSDQDGGSSGFDRLGGSRDVGLAEKARRSTLEDLEVSDSVGFEVRRLEARKGPVLVLHHE